MLQVEVFDGGVMESRRHLNVRGKSATLPAITDKDWLDLSFGVEAGVDAFALSFVKVGADWGPMGPGRLGRGGAELNMWV
jgi:pyruvate kinase